MGDAQLWQSSLHLIYADFRAAVFKLWGVPRGGGVGGHEGTLQGGTMCKTYFTF